MKSLNIILATVVASVLVGAACDPADDEVTPRALEVLVIDSMVAADFAALAGAKCEAGKAPLVVTFTSDESPEDGADKRAISLGFEGVVPMGVAACYAKQVLALGGHP